MRLEPKRRFMSYFFSLLLTSNEWTPVGLQLRSNTISQSRKKSRSTLDNCICLRFLQTWDKFIQSKTLVHLSPLLFICICHSTRKKTFPSSSSRAVVLPHILAVLHSPGKSIIHSLLRPRYLSPWRPRLPCYARITLFLPWWIMLLAAATIFFCQRTIVPTSSGVSDWANEWAQLSARAKQAARSRWMSWAVQANEQTDKQEA